MRLIKISLKRSVPFWSFKDIVLNVNQPDSSFIDIDKFTDTEVEVIQKSKDNGQIKIVDSSDNIIQSIKDTKELNEFLVDIEDVDEEDEVIEEVQSVTVPMDEEDEEDYVIEKQDYTEEAEIIMKKNGNTVRKLVSNMDVDDPSTEGIIKACLYHEKKVKQRKNMISFLISKLKEC